MRKKQVFPDQRFQRLVVIQETGARNGKRYALCRCDCGTEREFDIYGLLSGHTKSCGCLAREKLELGRKGQDLTCKTFGRLKAKYPTSDRRNRSIIWLCECSCTPGKLIQVPASDLVSGNTTSCGCALIDHTKSLKRHNEQTHTVDGVFVPLLRQKIQHNNKTGVKGVSVRRDKKGREKYIASITIKGKQHYLGIFPTVAEAAAARRRAEEQYHKPYLEGLENERD